MKTVYTAAMLTSLIALSAPTHAAPIQLSDQITFDRAITREPVNLLSQTRTPVRTTLESTVGAVNCDAPESQKVCDLRNAAARRAWEVVTEENANAGASPAVFSGAPPLGLLVPVRAIACDPALSTEECARLEKRIPSNPPGPLPPTAPAPPPAPIPPVPDEPGVSKAPGPAVDPVPATPPSVIPPPPTGDHELVQPPPKTDSKMPVIKPKAAPPVNPQPE